MGLRPTGVLRIIRSLFLTWVIDNSNLHACPSGNDPHWMVGVPPFMDKATGGILRTRSARDGYQPGIPSLATHKVGFYIGGKAASHGKVEGGLSANESPNTLWKGGTPLMLTSGW